MPLETNFNTPPYFDDYDANNNFYRVLFRPSTAVQARELTQLQSILQDQVEKFGRHIFIEGSIIDGCAIRFDSSLDYVKILDNYSNGVAIGNLTDFLGKKVYSPNTALEAVVVNVISGYEASAPDLNTLYIKYLNSGTFANGAPQKRFSASQAIQIRTTANTLFGNVTIANSSANAVGTAYSVGVSDGVIFQKGFFVRVESQDVVVTKYNNQPNGVSVGFKTNEVIVTADSDETLFDNALGSLNYNAPGANRLKLVANLVIRATDNTSVNATSANTSNFFSIVDFEAGLPAVVRTDPQYAAIGRQVARRTFEESGNYIIDPFELAVEANTANTDYNNLTIDRGIGYVQGFRVSFQNKKNIPVRKGTDTSAANDQVIGAGYGNYVLVNEFVGVFDTENYVKVNLSNSAVTAITSSTFSSTPLPANTLGTAYIRSIDYDSGTPGTANAQYKLYLYNINMANGYNFKDVKSITVQHASANGLADVVLTNNTAVLVDSNLDRLVFPLGSIATKNTSSRTYTYRQSKQVSFTTGSASFGPDGSNTVFTDTGNPISTAQEDNFIIIPTSNTGAPGISKGKPISLKSGSANAIVTSTTASIDVGISNSFTAEVFYNVTKQTAAPTLKLVNKNILVGIRANTHFANTVGPWPLGIPDVYKLRAVYQGTTLSNTNVNNVSKFILDNGQRDSFYGLSALKIKPGSGHTIGSNDILLVELDCFRADTSTGNGFFTVDSYVIDNSNTANVTAITTADIPVYTTLSGDKINLRDSIDFRPQFSNTAAYATSNSTATINPANSTVFNTSTITVPTPDTTIQLNLNYYKGRVDKVIISPEGRLSIVEGIPSISPLAPKDQDGTMTLGIINVPPFPSLTQEQSKLYNRFDYLITTTLQQQRRYTMRDVGVIDQRVKNLEYYTLLSALEQDTQNLLVTDSAGNNRFKNGIFVDSFNDFKISDTSSQEFKASLDTQKGILRPKFETNYIPLNEKGLFNTTKYGKNITLTHTSTPFITQPFAAKVRNCAESLIFTWKGDINLTPDGDNVPDIKQNPAINLELDLATPILALANGGFFNTMFGNWSTVNTSVSSTTSFNSAAVAGGILDTATTTTTINTEQVRDVISTAFNTSTQTYNYGQVVQDVSVQPFIRSRRVAFTATGLKPLTRFYPYFDDTAVSNNCLSSNSSLADVGSFGSNLVSDSSGNLYGIFYIPENTFKSGDRIFRLLDIDNLTTGADTITSHATSIYTGSNISISKANFGASITNPNISQTKSQQTQTVTSQTFNTVTTFIADPPSGGGGDGGGGWDNGGGGDGGGGDGGGGGDDPIAQTFLINPIGSEPGIFITAIDVFFQQKHPTLGVTVELREVDQVTGYPTQIILPYGAKILPASSINTSSDASVPTTVTFDTPVYVETNKQYCFVVKPAGNNTDTKIWVSIIGGTDVTTNAPIYKNHGMGDLLISSTNRLWTAFTREDIKCVIYRAQFSSSTGSVTYKTSNTEFLSANNFRGTFLSGETVYVSNAIVTVSSGATVNSSLSNSVVVSTVNAQTAFTIGETIYISSNTLTITDIATVTAIPNTTNIRLSSNISFVDNNGSIGKLAGNGNFTGIVEYVNTDTNDIYLNNSTANTTVNFNSGNTQTLIIGGSSGARANLVSVDNVNYSVVVPQFSLVSPAGTFVNLNINGTPVTSFARESLNTSIQNNVEIELVDFERRILSRSNEITSASGNNSLEVVANIITLDNKLSPVLGDIKKNIIAIRNVISTGNTMIADNETLPGGNTHVTSKYVSRRVVLAEGQDAEDIEVYLTASKPAGTEIYVYAKVQGAEDSESFDDKYWSLMEQVTVGSTVGSKVDPNSFLEYRYRLKVDTAANIATTKQAKRNSNNSNIIRYYTNAGAPVDDFKNFSIKIVMTSDSPHLIPRISDMRAIALQV
jgi:uncharacterized membrane protein YgcG